MTMPPRKKKNKQNNPKIMRTRRKQKKRVIKKKMLKKKMLKKKMLACL